MTGERTAEVLLDRLSLDEATELARQVLREHNGPKGAAENIARLTCDCPLATVVGAQVVSKERRHLDLLTNEKAFRDTNLLGDDSFRNVIDHEIDACTRAIIIWTPQSITRPWVIAQADHASRLGKLINTVALGVDINRLPKPFGNINALTLEDRKEDHR